jgi:monovalent cation/hydrogen antiporter
MPLFAEELTNGEIANVLLLLVAGAGLLVLVPKLGIPYPILLVLGGLALGFVPGMPEPELPPDLVLIGILPPLLYSAAFFTPLREFRANLKPISMLAVGLVLLTTVAVAVVAHEVVPGLPWAAAFALGAVVSPTDPIAATAIMQRLGAPRRVVSIVEGESLVNDGTGLVTYRFAVAAVVTGSFSLWEASLTFVGSVAGGAVVGLGVGWIVREVRRRLDFPPAEVTISLLTGYFAYLPAELLGVSAVIAAVVAGVYLGWYTPELTTAEMRILGESTWTIVTFGLNALLFTLIGLQLPAVIDGLEGYSTGELLGWAALVSLTVIAARFAWVFASSAVQHLAPGMRGRDSARGWRESTLISWCGMRGGVSLAAALAVPLTIDAGGPFPGRDLILFLTFSVIVATLVVQGLSLPGLIRVLDLEGGDAAEGREDAKARIRAAEAALARLEDLIDEDWVREDTAERVRGAYRFRMNRFGARLDGRDEDGVEARSQDYQRLRRELLEAERGALRDLRRAGVISDDVMRRVQRDLDLEEARLDI